MREVLAEKIAQLLAGLLCDSCVDKETCLKTGVYQPPGSIALRRRARGQRAAFKRSAFIRAAFERGAYTNLLCSRRRKNTTDASETACP